MPKRQSKKRGWDGTPPQRTYPYAVHTTNHLWGEPGVMVVPSKGECVSSNWSWSQPAREIVFSELVRSGDWHPYANPNGTPSEYREIHRIPVPDELIAGPQDACYLWVHEQVTAWVKERWGDDVFDPARRG